MTGGALVWAFVKRFWPLFVIVPLVFVLLIQRNTITGRTAERDAAVKAEAQVREANRSQEETIRRMAGARIDNDAIAAAVAERLGTVKTRETNTRTIIERAKVNDPQVRDWADSPIPNSVRGALNTPGN